MRVLIFIPLFLLLINKTSNGQTDPTQPNILLIIADDMGHDYMNGYQSNTLMPTTPNLDALRASGVTFMNAWATPQCTTTRGTIMSGKYGVNSGVQNVPDNLDLIHKSIFTELAIQNSNAYDGAVIGKWHISDPIDYNHPTQHGVDYYTGVFNSQVNDYYDWDKVVGGVLQNETEYVTTNLTNEAITWVKDRTNPWFLWLAHVAPHGPEHDPPPTHHTINPISSRNRKYVAMIEAMDYEIGRLLDSIPQPVLDNTMIIFIGDNGTPTAFLQNYPANRGKSTLYQGGLNVPFVVSGKGVTRVGDTENALINVTDIYATILEHAGGSLPGGIYNSFSFYDLLSNPAAQKRPYNYIDFELTGTGGSDFTIRDNQYKLIQYSSGVQEFYDLIADPMELNNLLDGTLSITEQAAFDDLELEAVYIRTDWSCRDLIENGIETSIDIGGTYCGIIPVCTFDNSTSTTNIGCCLTPTTSDYYSEAIYNDTRIISAADIPNHDYCKTGAHVLNPMNYVFEVDATPTIAASPTSVLNISNNRPSSYFGIGLNGVLIAPAPATPFIYENPNTGEFNWDWVYEPTNNQGAGPSLVGLDCASAHIGGQGYHYHGNMFEWAENIQAGLSTTSTPPAGPIQIGWAADGYPIIYRFGPDGVGGLALLQPSYQLKAGDRPGDGVNAPCGPYNGKYTNDFEYIAGLGDLDECNGINRNITLNTPCGLQTFDYFYMVTDDFPQISRCYIGEPNISFDNDNRGENCLVKLSMQKVTLNAGESITVGTNTYNSIGEYRDTVGNWELCDSIIITRIEDVLPLSLIDFYINNNKNNIELYWESIEEFNMSHFEIERSFDSRVWESIGKVDASGNSLESNYYTFLDNLNLLEEIPFTKVYYRLKMIDIDLSYEYSPIRATTINDINYFNFYINNNEGQILLNLDSKNIKNARFQLYNSNGQLIDTKQVDLELGNNIIFNDINDLANGLYIINISNDKGLNHSQRLIKIE